MIAVDQAVGVLGYDSDCVDVDVVYVGSWSSWIVPERVWRLDSLIPCVDVLGYLKPQRWMIHVTSVRVVVKYLACQTYWNTAGIEKVVHWYLPSTPFSNIIREGTCANRDEGINGNKTKFKGNGYIRDRS